MTWKEFKDAVDAVVPDNMEISFIDTTGTHDANDIVVDVNDYDEVEIS
jgi:electron transfer flavoprotein alpha/beta subunit